MENPNKSTYNREAYLKSRNNPAFKERNKRNFQSWYARNKEQHKRNCSNYYLTNTRDIYLKQSYGLSLEEYKQLHESQSGKCKICGVHQSKCKKALAVDHCHETGKIRGLLCQNCNVGLGQFKEQVELLEQALLYLRSV